MPGDLSALTDPEPLTTLVEIPQLTNNTALQMLMLLYQVLEQNTTCCTLGYVDR